MFKRFQFKPIAVVIASCALSGAVCNTTTAAEWSVPAAGNAFRTAPETGGQGFQRNRSIAWGDVEGVFSIYFRIDRPAELNLSINARVFSGQSTLSTRIGYQQFETVLDNTDLESQPIGQVKISDAGYVRIDLQGLKRSGDVFAELHGIDVSSDTQGLSLDFVKSNDGNMFYWGRRGPSVHLRYNVPKDKPLRHAYSELTVPKGLDPIGSYFMANGFGEGYFGIQVNSPSERRILFSVWSPFKTDNPRDIPEDQRITLLGKGAGVHVGKFGNEGSGGQSYLIYPWKAGVTYRFLTEVLPDGNGNTIYTSWFSEKDAGKWQLIASFRRPKTDSNLSGFHSFLENFAPTTGHLERRGNYQNVWVCNIDGEWAECTKARFSVDATGRGRHRLDFTGGADTGQFYLRNCGFFDETGKPGETFQRESTAAQKPEIVFDALPRG